MDPNEQSIHDLARQSAPGAGRAPRVHWSAPTILALFSYLLVLFFLRYILRTPPLLELNGIFYFFLGLLTVLAAGFSFPAALVYFQPAWWCRRVVLAGLVLTAVIYPFAGALYYQPEAAAIFFDASVIFFLLPFAAVEALFEKSLANKSGGARAVVRGIFLLTVVCGAFIALVYLKDLLQLGYYLQKKGNLNADRLLAGLLRLKNAHREMVVLVVPLFLVLSYGSTRFFWKMERPVKQPEDATEDSAASGEAKVRAILIFLATALIIAGQFLFYSRNQWISALVTILGISGLLLLRRISFFQSPRPLAILFTGLFLAVLGLQIYNPLGRAQYQAGRKDTIAVRYKERLTLLKSLNGNYFTGRGHGSGFDLVHEFAPKWTAGQKKTGKKGLRRVRKTPSKSHNSWLNFLYKGGVPQLLFFTGLFAFVLWQLVRFLITTGTPATPLARVAPLYLLGWFLYHFIRAGQDSVFHGHEQMAWLVLHLALFSAWWRQTRRSPGNPGRVGLFGLTPTRPGREWPG